MLQKLRVGGWGKVSAPLSVAGSSVSSECSFLGADNACRQGTRTPILAPLRQAFLCRDNRSCYGLTTAFMRWSRTRSSEGHELSHEEVMNAVMGPCPPPSLHDGSASHHQEICAETT